MVLGDDIKGDPFHLSYEELVDSPKEFGKKLYDYCEIQWQDDYVNQEKKHGCYH